MPILLKHRLEKPRRSIAEDEKNKKTCFIKKKIRGYIIEDESESELETNNNDISDTDEEISDEVTAFTKNT